MEFKGTKGKWKVDSYDTTLVIPDIRYTNEGICRCFSRAYTGNKLEGEANAKLIAHAPEMLDMLIKIHKSAEALNLTGDINHDEIKALIKSATEVDNGKI